MLTRTMRQLRRLALRLFCQGAFHELLALPILGQPWDGNFDAS